MILVFAGRPGSGKTTIVKELLSKFADWSYVEAVTTREPRQNDLTGQYEHISEYEFDIRKDAGEFILPVNIHGYKSAIKKTSVEALIKSSSNGLIVLEPSSVSKFIEYAPNSIPFYLKAGNSIDLQKRLTERGDDLSEIERKLSESEKWDNQIQTDTVNYCIIDNSDSLEDSIDQIIKFAFS